MLRAGEFADAEASARAVNAEPWGPMPGMVKRQCPQCRYLFAAPVAAGEDRKLLLPGLQPHSPAGSLSLMSRQARS